MNSRSLLVLAAVSLVLTACGSGSDDAPTPAPPANTAPQIGGLTDQSIDQDTSSGALPFSITDAQSGADPVQVSASSSDVAIIPADAIVLAGSGSARTITLTPLEDATGAVTISVTATDPQGAAATRTFVVNVRAVEASMTAFTNTAFAKGEADSPSEVRGMTFVQDADDATAFDNLLQ